MPTLQDLLDQTMFMTAYRGRKQPLPVGPSFTAPLPLPDVEDLDVDKIRRNSIWHLEYDPGSPARFRNITILSRGMGMNYKHPVPVLDELVFEDLHVLRLDGRKVELPLTAKHVLGAWWQNGGKVSASDVGLWQLETRVDIAMLIVFGFTFEEGRLEPLTMESCEELGEDLMPASGLLPQPLDFLAGRDREGWVCIGPSRYVVAVEVVLCKENDDYAPGGLVGMARVHPHVLFWSNEDLEHANAAIILTRPAKAMTHEDASMRDEHKALLVCDSNTSHMKAAPEHRPVPFTDNIYDYYLVDAHDAIKNRKPAVPTDTYRGDHPEQRHGEVTLADARFRGARVLERCVWRRCGGPDERREDITKMTGQGQFDNVHIAPRMRFEIEQVVVHPGGRSAHREMHVEDDIAMIFVCMHDCLHMHVRWGAIVKDKIVRGFFNGHPHALAGAPTVPENQTVFASLPNEHTLRYRALAEAVKAGETQVVCHHGLGYAVEEWPTIVATKLREVLRFGVEELASMAHEPFARDLPRTWATFYWRLRWGGKKGHRPVQRLQFALEECLR